MNNIIDIYNPTELAKLNEDDIVKQTHEYLVRWLDNFNIARRGGIHDFMETVIANMLEQSITNIDNYLLVGHKSVSPNEIMAITIDSFQKVLDKIKRNLDDAKNIGFTK